MDSTTPTRYTWLLYMFLVLTGVQFAIVAGQVNVSRFAYPKGSFDCLKDKHLLCTGDAISTARGQLNVTEDEPQSVGRVLFLPGIRLLDKKTGQAASFSTNFTFSVKSAHSFEGEGLAFVMVTDLSYHGCDGGFLGAYGRDGKAATKTLTVEFDTVMNSRADGSDYPYNDMNSNHVGLDLKDINSIVQVDAGTVGIRLCEGSTVTAWIDYIAPTEILEVRISSTYIRPQFPLISCGVNLSKTLSEVVYVGFSASTGAHCHSYHTILEWSFDSWGLPTNASSSSPPLSLPPTPSNGNSYPPLPTYAPPVHSPAPTPGPSRSPYPPPTPSPSSPVHPPSVLSPSPTYNPGSSGSPTAPSTPSPSSPAYPPSGLSPSPAYTPGSSRSPTAPVTPSATPAITPTSAPSSLPSPGSSHSPSTPGYPVSPGPASIHAPSSPLAGPAPYSISVPSPGSPTSSRQTGPSSYQPLPPTPVPAPAPSPSESGGGNGVDVVIPITTSIAGAVFLLILGVLLLFCCYKKHRHIEEDPSPSC